MLLIYCYDAYCGWCYGFSPVIKKLADDYAGKIEFEVLSGGMIPEEDAKPIKAIAPYIQNAYKTVEERTGIKFGEDFLWHINNPDQSDWYPSSLLPAVALNVFKDYQPDRAVYFAADLQYALNYEGRDLTDKEAYRHLMQKYDLPEDEFFNKLQEDNYKQNALYEFTLVKQLRVTGFPCVLMQASDTKFYLLAQGYTEYEILKDRVDNVIKEIESAKNGS